jgi:hypothetical protein
MSKIQKIKVVNLKAISEQEINLNGCSVVVTGANRKGKSTLLSGLPDRIRGEKPEIIVKEGTTNGMAEMLLTTGEKFIWTFDGKSEKLVFVTKEGIKTPCTREIGTRFFPELFNIDEFLHMQPKQQTKELTRLLGIDVTNIDLRYKSAYDDRTYFNKKRDEAKIQLQSFSVIPVKKEAVNIDGLIKEKENIRQKLNAAYIANKTHNDKLRSEHAAKVQAAYDEVRNFNQEQIEKSEKFTQLQDAIEDITTVAKRHNVLTLIDISKLTDMLSKLPKPLQHKTIPTLTEPLYVVEMPDDAELKSIDEKINEAHTANANTGEYDKYITIKESYEKAEKDATDADVKVKEIEKEKKDMIKAAKLPEGFEITDDGILIEGLPLSDNQISTSQKYIAALKLAFISIGQVRSMHFDASTLDKFNLAEIEAWAAANDLQLLIEKPDFDGGEIQYQFINEIV